MISTKTLFSATVPVLGLALVLSLSSCGSGSNQESGDNGSNAELFKDDGKGIGPVKEVKISGLDATMADAGKAIFDTKCVSCHKLTDEKLVGPGLKGVTLRQKPEWIMNMILNPTEMTQKDPVAKELLAKHLTQMVSLGLTEQEARNLLEYLRQQDGAK